MSREIISPGNPFSIAAYDRGFGSVPKNILVVHSGSPDANGVPTQLGQLQLGGNAVMGTPAVSSTTGAASNTATIQLQDCYGNAFAGVRRVFFWVSATAGATSVGTSTTGLTTTVTTGVAVTAVAGNLSGDCLTDATGKLVVTLADSAGTETRYCNFAIEGRIYSTAAIITP